MANQLKKTKTAPLDCSCKHNLLGFYNPCICVLKVGAICVT